jgi:diguanylate cyclase (GGDEF)-like protein/PAS domain S-box-containing protein
MSLRLNPFEGRSLRFRLSLFTLTIVLLSLWSLAFYASSLLPGDLRWRLLLASLLLSLIAGALCYAMLRRLLAPQPVTGPEETGQSLAGFTQVKQTQDELQLAASVFTHAREGIMITAADGAIIDVNAAFSRITGFSREEVLGCNPRLLSSGRQNKIFYEAMWHDLIASGEWDGEVWNRRKSGEIYPELLTISTVRGNDGKAFNYVAMFTDITSIKANQNQLEKLAHFDVLTGLPNRVLLADRLQQSILQALRRKQTVAVAYLDLDGFKAINDQHGHKTGDQLLMTVASRMKQVLRESDTLARLGGDEFVAVLNLDDVAASVPLLTRLLAAASQSVAIAGLNLQVSASIGVTFYPQSQEIDPDQLLRQADHAMYQAKLAGKNRFHLFDTQQDRSIRGHHRNVQHIREALQARQFVLYYQPKVNMRRGSVIGAEALIRWVHPERGLLLPGEFLPQIDNHPLSIELGDWVIERTLTQMEHWQAAGFTIPISINVSAYQLQQKEFATHLSQMLALHPTVRAQDLELEVLESSALEDIDHIARVIESCRKLGIRFALDDFGTGYSSLTYLKHLRVSLLKIDRSFVHNMLDDPDDLAILEGVIGMASAFRRQVIAEGVETVAHGTLLLQLGCELAQGYGIAAPMAAADLPGWAARWQPDPAWADLPRVSYDNLPVLRAAVEYRAWIAAVEAFLMDKPDAPPPVHPQQLRLDSWLSGAALARHDSQPAWQAIQRLHQQALALATRLLKLKALDRSAQALSELNDLRFLHQRLLEQLAELEQATRPSELS